MAGKGGGGNTAVLLPGRAAGAGGGAGGGGGARGRAARGVQRRADHSGHEAAGEGGVPESKPKPKAVYSSGLTIPGMKHLIAEVCLNLDITLKSCTAAG